MSTYAGGRTKRRLISAGFLAAAALVAGLAFLAESEGKAADPVQIDAEPRYWIEQVVEGLRYPWAMAWLPDGDVLVTERLGKLRIVRDGVLLPLDIAGVPKVLNSSMFDGILDVKLDPDFASNRFIYLTFTTGTDTARTGSVFKARLDGKRLNGGKVIFSTSSPAPAGGPCIMRILFLPDKTMLIGVGSGGQGSRGMVQRLDNQAGKIIRIDRDGRPIADGPFAKTPGARPEIWAIGLRNPSGLTRAQDGSIWAVDIGPKGGDELNLIKPGANYGWPLVSWGFDYSGQPMSNRQDGAEFTAPILAWSPSRAPSGLTQYLGDRYPAWHGDLFLGELAGHTLHRVRIRGGKATVEEELLTDLNERIRSVEVGPDGLLYVITDSMTGRLLRLRPGIPAEGDRARIAKPYDRSAGVDLYDEVNRRGVFQDRVDQASIHFKYDETKARLLFGQNCAACHSIGGFTGGEIGPNLNGIVGRRSGQLPGYDYSAALQKKETSVQWDRDSLVAFISNPQAYYPGTKMASAPVSDYQVALQISAFLEHNGADGIQK